MIHFPSWRRFCGKESVLTMLGERGRVTACIIGEQLTRAEFWGKLGWVAKRHSLEVLYFSCGFLLLTGAFTLYSLVKCSYFWKKHPHTPNKSLNQSFTSQPSSQFPISSSKSFLLGQIHFLYLQLKGRTLFVLFRWQPKLDWNLPLPLPGIWAALRS